MIYVYIKYLSGTIKFFTSNIYHFVLINYYKILFKRLRVLSILSYKACEYLKDFNVYQVIYIKFINFLNKFTHNLQKKSAKRTNK